MRIDVVDGLLHRRDLLGLFVGDLGLEFLFERHDQLDRIQRVSAEVVDERGFVLDLGLVYAQLFGDDFLDSLLHVFHASPPHRGPNVANAQFYQINPRTYYVMYIPPLTCSVAPVMYPASREARNSTALATSSGNPNRPRGIRSISFSR